MELKRWKELDRELKPQLVSRIIRTQRRLGRALRRLPDSTMLLDNLDISDDLTAQGGFGSVFCGTYGRYMVAVKSLHPPDDTTQREKMWKVKHDVLSGEISALTAEVGVFFRGLGVEVPHSSKHCAVLGCL